MSPGSDHLSDHGSEVHSQLESLKSSVGESSFAKGSILSNPNSIMALAGRTTSHPRTVGQTMKDSRLPSKGKQAEIVFNQLSVQQKTKLQKAAESDAQSAISGYDAEGNTTGASDRYKSVKKAGRERAMKMETEVVLDHPELQKNRKTLSDAYMSTVGFDVKESIEGRKPTVREAIAQGNVINKRLGLDPIDTAILWGKHGRPNDPR